MSMWDRCVAVLVCLLAPAAVGGGPAAQDGMTTRGLMREAAGARLEGRLEQAASLYSRVIDLEPGNRLALYNAAIILEKLGRRDLAVGVWSKALKADAGDLFAYEHLLRNLHRDDLETLIAQETLRVKADRDSTLKRLHLALDEMAAGRGSAAVKPLEEVLLIRPSSNIAYLFLKDAFPSQSALEAYLNHLARRAAAPGAPENLRLLHLRFLMEGGEWQTARKLARAWNWSREMSRELLFRAGLLDRPAAAPGIRPENKGRSVEAAARSPDKAEEPSPDASETGMSSAGSRTGAGDSLDPQRGRPHEAEAETEVPPDFGPADPRSAPFHLSRSEAALVRKDEPTAMKEMRQALEAAPLLQQPRILLALMLEEANRPQEARQALRGAVEVSPWDLYMQAWRTVRDEYIDPDHDGVDLYALRRRARESIQTVADAKRQIHFLLDVLNDRYARLFPAGEFARYLLAPNAGRKALLLADDVAAGETWLPIPDHPESDRAAGLASLPPEDGGATLPAPSGRPAGGGIPAPAPGSFTEEDHGDVSGTGETGDSRRTGGAAPDSHEMVKRAAKDAGSSGNLAGGSMEQTSGREAHFMVRPAMRDPVMQAAKLTLRMGYIRIPTLNGLDVPARLDQALASLHGVEGAILDLRGNGGGDGGIAAEVASRFLPPGTTVCTYLTRRGPHRLKASRHVARRFSGPLVVVVDEATASAAEILAAALRDQAGALLLGRRTAGKGVGQRALLLPDGSGLSLTRVVLQAPGGERWDGTGLDPAVHAVAVRQPATGRVVADLPLKKAMRRLEEQIQSLRSKR